MISITPPQTTEYNILLDIWEASVRATHHFLSEEAIIELKFSILNNYFPMVSLFCSYNNDQQKITGFGGVHEHKLEMLFIDPAYKGQGIGKILLNHAITQYNINSVDVNEHNPQALGFYLYCGFEIISRSPTDGQGNPYPILHLQLKKQL